MKNDSYVKGKERCPECSKVGKDTSGDNLAVYSDGHKFCFSCGYIVYSSGIKAFMYKHEEYNDEKEEQHKVFLPSDSDIHYPQRALDWVGKYDLTRIDLLHHNVLWSESEQRLIFPVYGDGNLIAWQGRSFNLQSSAVAKIPKWYGKGNLKDTFNIIGKGNIVVLVEDIVSAIKITKAGYQAMPLYGSFIGRERFKRLYSLFGTTSEVTIWLDPDKRKEAVKELMIGNICGLKVKVIFSDKDPKEHSYEEIKNLLTS